MKEWKWSDFTWKAPDGKYVPYSQANLTLQSGRLVNYADVYDQRDAEWGYDECYIQVSRWSRKYKIAVITETSGGEDYTRDGDGLMPAMTFVHITRIADVPRDAFENDPGAYLQKAIEVLRKKDKFLR